MFEHPRTSLSLQPCLPFGKKSIESFACSTAAPNEPSQPAFGIHTCVQVFRELSSKIGQFRPALTVRPKGQSVHPTGQNPDKVSW
jgi:hypothetical protein